MYPVGKSERTDALDGRILKGYTLVWADLDVMEKENLAVLRTTSIAPAMSIGAAATTEWCFTLE